CRAAMKGAYSVYVHSEDPSMNHECLGVYATPKQREEKRPVCPQRTPRGNCRHDDSNNEAGQSNDSGEAVERRAFGNSALQPAKTICADTGGCRSTSDDHRHPPILTGTRGV